MPQSESRLSTRSTARSKDADIARTMLVFGAFSLAITTALQAATYPGATWESHDRVGWSDALLKSAREHTAARKTAAVVIVQGGRVVDQRARSTGGRSL